MDTATTITAADIRACRARVNETQTQFGDRFGVDRSTIAVWEREGPPRVGPGRKLLERILTELGGGNGAVDVDGGRDREAAADGG